LSVVTFEATSKVPTLRAGYFASENCEMNARKSLGGIVCSRPTWYAVVITCRGRHWSNCQHEPAHVAETMKFIAGA